MSGSGLWTFLLVCVELLFVGAIIFLGIDLVVVADDNFKKIAKYGVGAALVLYFLFAVGAVLGLGGGQVAAALGPVAFIVLVISLLILFVVLRVINIVVDKFAPDVAKEFILTIINAVALIVVLIIAANTLSGGQLANSFRLRSEGAWPTTAALPGGATAALPGGAAQHLPGLLSA